jgi:hypothetical protein
MHCRPTMTNRNISHLFTSRAKLRRKPVGTTAWFRQSLERNDGMVT